LSTLVITSAGDGTGKLGLYTVVSSNILSISFETAVYGVGNLLPPVNIVEAAYSIRLQEQLQGGYFS